MANQRTQYPHPGPSSYYTHSSPPPPPPHFAYVPNPNAVQYYPYPPPSPMTGPTHPAHNHPPASPRPNSAHRGGFHPHNAPGPSYHPPYHHYHYVPPPQPLASPVGHPASPYNTHQPKYSPHAQVPYSPHFHPQPNGSYPPPQWQTQPLSPLPKQLSMLPPPQPSHEVPSQPTHPPPQPPPPHRQPSSQPPPPPPQPAAEPEAPSSPVVAPAAEPQPPPSAEAPPAPAVASSPAPELAEPPSEDFRSASPPDSPPMPAMDLESGWVIWSRKGRPSDAPGIIISPRANPPDHVIQKAMQLPSPAASPRIKPKAVAFVPSAVTNASHEESKDTHSPQSEHAEPLSSSATETTSVCSTAPDTPVPGSPLSTNTSVSLTAPSPASKPLETSDAKPAPEVVATVAPAAASEPATETSAAAAPETVPVPVAPAPAPKPAVKKSWASLLQQPADATASSSKSRLPTSSVVGFSIPAAALGGSASGLPNSNASGSPSNVPQRPELLTLLNNGPSGPSAPPKIRPRGLVNTGNMCFANTILQVLVYCPPFNRLFSELGKYLTGPVVGSQKDGTKATPLVDATIQFLKEFMPEPPKPKDAKSSKGKEREEEDDFYELESFIPTYIYDVMKEKKRFAGMVGGYQEDAEEFLGFYLDTLEDELLSISTSLSPPKPKEEPEEDPATQGAGWLEVGRKNKAMVTRTVKSTESPVTRLFGGKFRSTLRAPHQRDSVTVEDWRALRLDISREQVKTVQDALHYISHPEPVQISIPTKPGQVIEASQQTLIDSLPPILVLHMKRFQYDTNVGDVVKISKQVAYGADLEIPSDLMAPNRRTPLPVKYQLFGVLYHHGQSASGGHYTLDILHPNRDMNDRPRAAWIRIDDELVSDVRAEDVFGQQERDDRTAYLLFYRRLGMGSPARSYAQA
ncbi:hypothetical protein EIP91_004177 [Steccherinum ochraceum]|uniref:ubiquitinyl hydrolase 1 n=1 Tax=Steccherinum ochraceum TaxID=92696 RepID=A0A4R0RR64_9APHY|nr:hypothetical protein EIP91_004177 [Steccherinum ochraceum]